MRTMLFNYPIAFSLSLSSVCNARCIWCPIGQRLNKSGKSKFMSLDIVDKILKDTTDKKIQTIFLVDMGEPLLNPDFKEIVLRCKKVHPDASYWLCSNFFLMDDDMARFVLDNEFSAVGLNIDGITEEAYYAVKHLPLKVVMGNLMNFLRLREEVRNKEPGRKLPSLRVSITTEPRYFMEIGEPERATVKDETRKICEFMRGVLEHEDYTFLTVSATWAERRKWARPREGSTVCSNMSAVGQKCCIDTDGNIIPCCLDYDSECKFGNVMDNTIEEIWNGDKRKKFLGSIINLRYADIGLPCSICHD